MTGRDLSGICKLFKQKGFKEIPDPQSDFHTRLLRCKTPLMEKGADSLLLKSPGSDWGHSRLSNNMEDRVKMRGSWYYDTPKNMYVSVTVEPSANLRDHIEKLFSTELSDMEILRVSQYLCKIITNTKLPSFEPFIVIWHLKQYKKYPDGKFVRMPVHAHLVFARKTKRVTTEERKLLDKK